MEHIVLEAIKLFANNIDIEYVKSIILDFAQSEPDLDVNKLNEDIKKFINIAKEREEKWERLPVTYRKMEINGREVNIPCINPKDLPDDYWNSDSDEEHVL